MDRSYEKEYPLQCSSAPFLILDFSGHPWKGLSSISGVFRNPSESVFPLRPIDFQATSRYLLLSPLLLDINLVSSTSLLLISLLTLIVDPMFKAVLEEHGSVKIRVD
jgi:hypothetical protein